MTLFRLCLAAICALPPFLLQLCILPISIVFSIPMSYLLLCNDPSVTKTKKKTTKSPSTRQESSPSQQQQRQIIVIGGSTGIGYAIAMAAAQEASKQMKSVSSSSSSSNQIPISRIVIVARNVTKLEQAQHALRNVLIDTHNKDETDKVQTTTTATVVSTTTTTAIVEIVSVDVTDPRSEERRVGKEC